MWAPFPDFRSPLPKRETKQEQRRRVMQERINADSFLKYRMETIAGVYSVPLRRIHYDKVIRYAIPNVDQLRAQIKKDHSTVSTIHILKLGDSGEINARSKLLGQPLPQDFYRSTKLAAWKVYRFHYLNRQPTTLRGPEQQDNKNFDVSFNDFKQMVDNEIRKTKSRELEVGEGKGLNKKNSSFIMLKEIQRMSTRRGSMGGEFSGTLAKEGYQNFDQEQAGRRLSQEVRRLSIARHVEFPPQLAAIPTPTDSDTCATEGDTCATEGDTGATEGDTGTNSQASDTAPSETATLSSRQP